MTWAPPRRLWVDAGVVVVDSSFSPSKSAFATSPGGADARAAAPPPDEACASGTVYPRLAHQPAQTCETRRPAGQLATT